MFHKFRERFGTAGLVVSVVALVFALAGGAFAASGGLNAKQKKQVKAIAKSFQGTGPAGAAGPAGAPGLDGLKGADGPIGNTGPQGPIGNTGPQGPIGNTGPQGPIGNTGPQGPIGNTGSQGPAGSPWTVGGTLPGGETLTGSWSFGQFRAATQPTGNATVFLPLSFPIPLPNALDADHVHLILANGMEQTLDPDTFTNPLVAPTECGSGIGAGVGVTNPQANPGHLCVYVGFATAGTTFGSSVFGALFSPIVKPSTTDTDGADTAGAKLRVSNIPDDGHGSGTFAVTAP